jgi:hypothetical protein
MHSVAVHREGRQTQLLKMVGLVLLKISVGASNAAVSWSFSFQFFPLLLLPCQGADELLRAGRATPFEWYDGVIRIARLCC